MKEQITIYKILLNNQEKNLQLLDLLDARLSKKFTLLMLQNLNNIYQNEKQFKKNGKNVINLTYVLCCKCFGLYFRFPCGAENVRQRSDEKQTRHANGRVKTRRGLGKCEDSVPTMSGGVTNLYNFTAKFKFGYFQMFK